MKKSMLLVVFATSLVVSCKKIFIPVIQENEWGYFKAVKPVDTLTLSLRASCKYGPNFSTIPIGQLFIGNIGSKQVYHITIPKKPTLATWTIPELKQYVDSLGFKPAPIGYLFGLYAYQKELLTRISRNFICLDVSGIKIQFKGSSGVNTEMNAGVLFFSSNTGPTSMPVIEIGHENYSVDSFNEVLCLKK